jgi:hypothetical protein
MEEMTAMSGRTFIIAARADKTCDTIEGTGVTRSMNQTVHLDGPRCDGAAHGGCQATCNLYFKEEWLERVAADSPDTVAQPASEGADEELLRRLRTYSQAGPNTYRCQATQVLQASTPLPRLRHYWWDLRTRNVTIGRWLAAMVWVFVEGYQGRSGRLPKYLQIRNHHRLPDLRGPVRESAWPEWERLDLMEGDLVEVRSREEIVATLDDKQQNRGLSFDEEMLRLCGRRGRVLKRVERIIDEKTGRMLKIRKDTIIVDGMIGCDGLYHKMCQRQAIAFLREAWLKRVDQL